jgi:hypothetical protein
LKNLRLPKGIQAGLKGDFDAYIVNPLVLQNINNAGGTVVNCDYFPVKINSLPIINGIQWTAADVMDYFRRNINKFTDNSIATFHPYVDVVMDETMIWNSTNYLGAVLHLDMAVDGSVIISDVNSGTNGAYSFTATTIKSYQDQLHPVSGNRKFGIMPQGTGWTFYTTAVDRVTRKVNEKIADILSDLGVCTGFCEADNLWRAMQNKMVSFINNPAPFINDPNQTVVGGSAELYTNPGSEIILRPSYNYVKDYLTGKKTEQQLRQALGCP